MLTALAGYARATLPADRRTNAIDRLPSTLTLMEETTAGACEVAAMLAGWFGYDGAVRTSLVAFYEGMGGESPAASPGTRSLSRSGSSR